jgi:hypothetical protein
MSDLGNILAAALDAQADPRKRAVRQSNQALPLLAGLLGGNNPMGGPAQYGSEWEANRKREFLAGPNYVPPAWVPPGANLNPPDLPPLAPGEGDPDWYDPKARKAPRFHRLNPAPRNNWRDMET